MKLLHTADIHIGMSNYSKLDPETGLDSRLLDFLKTFDYIVDYAIKEGVDAFIFAGDAYKTRDPSPTQQRGFGERIKRLAKAGIPVVMVVGNHDTPNAEGKANTLDIYSALEIEGVYVSRTVEMLNIPTKSGNLQVVTTPWLHRSKFKNLGEMLNSKYEKLNPKDPAILVGHLEVSGAAFGSEKGLAITSDATIPLSLLTDRKLSYVALGHIHKQQNLNPANNPPVIYSSSPERIDFSEEKEPKGFMMVTIANSKLQIASSQNSKAISHEPFATSYEFIPTPAREFLSISCKLDPKDENPTQKVLNLIKKEDIKDKVVRVYIDVPTGCKELRIDQIKKALSEAHFIAGIIKTVERVDRQKLTDTSEVEKLTPSEALLKYFETKKYTAERIKLLEKYAAEITN